MNTKWLVGGNPLPGQCLRLLWHQSRLPDDALGVGAVLLEEAAELIRSIEHRLQAHLDQSFLAEAGVGADRRHLVPQLDDDRIRRAGRRPAAGIDVDTRDAMAARAPR